MIPWFAQSAYEGQHMRHVVADEKIVSGRKKRNLRDGVGFIDPKILFANTLILCEKRLQQV